MDKKRILIVNDISGWAFEHTALQLKKHLTDFDIDILNQKEFSSKYLKWKSLPYNNVYFQNWLLPGIKYNKFLSKIASHRFENDLSGKSDLIVPQYKAISCVSRRIYEMLKVRYPEQTFFIGENGVDEELFVPIKTSSDKFRIGFSSKEMGGDFKTDLKGYHSLLLPLKERMSKYPDIEFLVHDNNYKNAIPHSEMPSIYSKMDCLLITSYREGSPGAAVEAASMGIPIIGTDVGVVRDLIGPEWLVEAFNEPSDIASRLDVFEEKIIKLKNDVQLREEVGKRNREEILKGWTWKIKASQWRDFFNYKSELLISDWRKLKGFHS